MGQNEARIVIDFLKHVNKKNYVNMCTKINNISSSAFCNPRGRTFWLVAWHSGRTSVSDRRTFAVLRSTCG